MKRINKFNGRRESALGHGAGVAEIPSLPKKGTVRQVPLSPLPENSSSIQGSQRFTTDKRNIRRSSTILSASRSTSRLQSSVSSQSRYDDPEDESSLESYSQRDQRSRQENDYSITWEDEDWKTEESGASISGSRYRGMSDFGRRGLSTPPPLPVPNPWSKGPSMRSEISGPSQSNSLRFI